MGEDWEVSTEVGGGARILGNVLPRGSSVGDIFGGGDMGAIGANGAEVRGGACRLPLSGYKDKGKASKGCVVATGNGKNSPPGSEETAAPEIFGQETGNSGRVDGPMTDF